MDASTTFDDSSTVASAPGFGRSTANSCANWTSASAGVVGGYVAVDGGVSFNGVCNVLRPLACCNSAPKTTFVGVTGAAAVMAGRPAMHATCNAQFVGSHRCHAAEYLRAHSATPLPASGAWMDASISADGTSSVGGAAMFGRASANSCANWTSTSAGVTGTYGMQVGAPSFNGVCSVARPVACCL